MSLAHSSGDRSGGSPLIMEQEVYMQSLAWRVVLTLLVDSIEGIKLCILLCPLNLSTIMIMYLISPPSPSQVPSDPRV